MPPKSRKRRSSTLRSSRNSAHKDDDAPPSLEVDDDLPTHTNKKSKANKGSKGATTAATPKATTPKATTPKATHKASSSHKSQKKKSMKKSDKEKKEEEKKKKKAHEPTPWGPGVPGYTWEVKIPNGVQMLCKWRDGKLHYVRVLESKPYVDQKSASAVVKKQMHQFIYYVHFVEFNRRMDAWVRRENMHFESEVKADQALLANAVMNPVICHDEHENFDDESLKAHEAATKVKNIDSIIIGPNEMPAWYFSPFPAEYNKFTKLYFCEFCLDFFGYHSELLRHTKKCQLRHPPGNEIYRSDEQNLKIAMFEVDGNKEVKWCQNLCYIAKLFLDHKTLQYDTTPFLFYVLTEVDSTGCHLVGYFSKEKQSDDGYNLACILTLPCHQRKGYGAFLISFSYELSKIERKVGSPEKPLSDLGLVSYRSYWTKVLLKILEKRSDDVSIKEISKMTAITNDDITNTLRYLGVLKYVRGEHILHVPPKIFEMRGARKRRPADPKAKWVDWCDPSKLHWVPFLVPNRRHRGAF